MKLQRFISLVIVVLLLFSGSISAINDKPVNEKKDTTKYYQKEARALEKAGIIQGDNDGNLQLGENFKRKDIPIIISRLYNEEEKAKKSNFKIDFTDIDTDDYFYRYVCWAVEKNLIKGISDKEFGANEDVTLKEVEIILLRTLGYEEEVKNSELIEPLSESLGLRDEIQIQPKENPVINRNVLSKLIYNALFIECKGSTLKLKDVLNVKM